MTATDKVLCEIADERARQDATWGEQNHLDGTKAKWSEVADGMRARAQLMADKGDLTWHAVMEEEIWEAYAETDPVKLRAELIQVAAVATAWVEAIDRREVTA